MNPHYDIPNLTLTDEYLTDPILLALAWKRAHGYVRSLNWYADNFELDASSLFLQENCEAWAEELSGKRVDLKPLELVPAPKTNQWEFIKPSDEELAGNEQCLVWQPVAQEALSLRPLAHIGIKEQTYFTLLISCLANTVETKQGNPSAPLNEVHEKRVVNYGNRLYCFYSEDGKAEHNYGATTLYSKYFVDFRNFLKRPYHFAQLHSTEKLPEEDVYIVELDLKQFFDKVCRKKLVKKIKELIEEQAPKLTEAEFENSSVVQLLSKFDNWQWSDQAKNIYNICPKKDNNKDEAPLGIPQGLVAGGFLANIYLLNIDEALATLLNKQHETDIKIKIDHSDEIKSIQQLLKKYNIKINDYCRYVDDIRLVITAPKLTKKFTLGCLTKKISSLASVFLRSKQLGLKINKSKTRVIPYRGKPEGISSQADNLQERLSGPQSPEQIDKLINELETLLVLTGSENSTQDGNSCKINKLADIERSTLDVREDTLRRFAANKLSSVLKQKRHFTSRDVDGQGNPIAGDWDYMQERIARRLIAAWSKDPALVLLLKKGLELFPSPKVLEPVLEQFAMVKKRQDKSQTAIMNYCLAEVFRHSATVIHKKDLQAIPAQANVSSYFEILQQKAATLVSAPRPKKGKWDLLTEQARFLLLVRMDTTLDKTTGDAKQDLIFKLAKGYRNIKLPKDFKQEDISLCILLANQLLDTNQPLLRAALELISKQDFTDEGQCIKLNVLTAIATQSPELAGQLIQQARLLKGDHAVSVKLVVRYSKLLASSSPALQSSLLAG